MPTGSHRSISSSFALQGRTAEKTSCSRTRRAINCVYCPPKSRTTMPFLTLNDSLSVPRGAPQAHRGWRLSKDDVHQFLRHDDGLDDGLPVDHLRDARVGKRSLFQFFLAKPVIDQNFAAQFAVDLNDDLELLLAREVLAIFRPSYGQNAAGMPEHLPELLG